MEWEWNLNDSTGVIVTSGLAVMENSTENNVEKRVIGEKNLNDGCTQQWTIQINEMPINAAFEIGRYDEFNEFISLFRLTIQESKDSNVIAENGHVLKWFKFNFTSRPEEILTNPSTHPMINQYKYVCVDITKPSLLTTQINNNFKDGLLLSYSFNRTYIGLYQIICMMTGNTTELYPAIFTRDNTLDMILIQSSSNDISQFI